MTWPAWVLVALDVLLAVVAVRDVGKEPPPTWTMTSRRAGWFVVVFVLHATIVIQLGTS